MVCVIYVFCIFDCFVVGIVGQFGNCMFYLQVVYDFWVVLVVLEKQQVVVFVECIGVLLFEVNCWFGILVFLEFIEIDDFSFLIMLVDVEFWVGMMGLGWDLEVQSVVVELLVVIDVEFDVFVVFDDIEEGFDVVWVFLMLEFV